MAHAGVPRTIDGGQDDAWQPHVPGSFVEGENQVLAPVEARGKGYKGNSDGGCILM